MTNQETIKKDIKKLQQNKQFLTILVLLFVVLFFWVTISLITSQTTEKISPELQKISKALTPVIDTGIFSTIQEKRLYSDEELSGFTIFKVLLSRDGRSQRVVPIEVTLDEIEPTATPAPRQGRSLLQQESETTNETTTEQPAANGSTGLGEQL